MRMKQWAIEQLLGLLLIKGHLDVGTLSALIFNGLLRGYRGSRPVNGHLESWAIKLPLRLLTNQMSSRAMGH